MREQGIFLEYRVHRTFMGWSLCYFHPRNSDFAFRSCLKTGNETQQRGFPATGRAENRDKLALFTFRVTSSNAVFSPKYFETWLTLNDGFIFLHIHTKVWVAKVHISVVFHLRVNLI